MVTPPATDKSQLRLNSEFTPGTFVLREQGIDEFISNRELT